MSDQINYDHESLANIKRMSADAEVRRLSQEWIDKTGPYRYVYNWRWLGLPIIQLPADILATQEIIWSVKPTIIIETGIARGGSILFNASQLAMLDLSVNGSATLRDSKRRCIGVDIDIREHNREAIESHFLSPMISLIEGSSIEEKTIDLIKREVKPDDIVLVILDSNHSYDHVIVELEKYSNFVSLNSYIIAHDTGIEYAPPGLFQNRDWGVGNNSMTAVKEFLNANAAFKIDRNISGKLLITSSPDGYLKRVA